jgi:hypothetical protein
MGSGSDISVLFPTLLQIGYASVPELARFLAAAEIVAAVAVADLDAVYCATHLLHLRTYREAIP